MERVSVAAGPVVLIKVRILPHAASPGKGQGMAKIRHKVLYHLHRRDKWVICTGQQGAHLFRQYVVVTSMFIL